MMSSRAWFRAVLCLSTALMMAISWPLWVTGGDFPRVPWIGGMRLLPAWASWVRFVVALVAMIAAAWPGRCDGFGLFTSLKRKRRTVDPEPSLALQARVGRGPIAPPKPALAIALLMSAWMVLEDQFRLQPWIYQFLLMGFAIAACPPGQAARLCRWFVIAQYFHSGLSKLDYSFVNEMGASFLVHGARALGGESARLSRPLREVIIFAMPCWEIGVATALMFKARRFGVFGAVALHLVLIATLSPWGMNHSANVLLWNTAMLVEIILLFKVKSIRVVDPPGYGHLDSVLSATATTLILAAALLPLGERSGFWDTWPSFALYSSSNERVTVISAVDKGDFPIRLNGTKSNPRRDQHLYVVDVLDIQGWSLRERHVPLYPSTRALNGVAEALSSRYLGQHGFLVTHESRANRRTGLRKMVGLKDFDAVREFGDTFWLNAHPAR